MAINKENYPEYFLDFFEGRLSEADKADIFVFLDAHPELKEEFEAFDMVGLIPDTVAFPDRESLKRGMVTPANYEWYFAAYVEGDLSDDERAAVDYFASGSAEMARELRIMQLSVLGTDQAVAFPGKSSLKHHVLASAKPPVEAAAGADVSAAASASKAFASDTFESETAKSGVSASKDSASDISDSSSGSTVHGGRRLFLARTWYYISAAAVVLWLAGLFFLRTPDPAIHNLVSDLPAVEEADKPKAVADVPSPARRLEEAVTRPAEALSRPAETISRPAEAVSRPEEAVTRPEEAVTRPEEALSRPAEALSRPAETISRPAEALSRPEEAMSRPEEALSRPAEAMSRQEEALTHMAVVITPTDRRTVAQAEARNMAEPSSRELESESSGYYSPIPQQSHLIAAAMTSLQPVNTRQAVSRSEPVSQYASYEAIEYKTEFAYWSQSMLPATLYTEEEYRLIAQQSPEETGLTQLALSNLQKALPVDFSKVDDHLSQGRIPLKELAGRGLAELGVIATNALGIERETDDQGRTLAIRAGDIFEARRSNR